MAMDVMELLRQRVLELRKRKGWSQHELSHHSGVPQPTIWRLEHGRLHNVSVVVVRRLAQAFGVDVDYMVGTHDPDVEFQPAAAVMVGARARGGSATCTFESTSWTGVYTSTPTLPSLSLESENSLRGDLSLISNI